MKKFLLFIILQLVLISPSFSQLSFDHVSVNNGLSQSTVLTILKDSRGYMWFGTRDRLNKYDARNIKTYNYDYRDTTSISCNDYVFFVFEDRQKNLWIGTSKGLNRYIPESDSFERILHKDNDRNSLTTNNIYCTYQDHSGKLWFGSDKGLNMLSSPASRKFTRFFKASPGHPGLSGNQVYAIYEDREQNLWVGTTEGITRMSLKNGKYIFKTFNSANGLEGNFVQTITQDHEGNICIGTQTGGVNIFDPKTATFSHLKHNPSNTNSLINNDIRKIVIDKDDKLWIGTMNGLDIYDQHSRQFKLYQHDVENRNSLSDNSVKDIYFEDNGTVWIGTMFGGVNIIHPNTVPFNIYQASKYKNSISGNVVSTIIADAKQNLWIGTEGNGLNYYDKAKLTFTHYTNNPNAEGSIRTNFVKAIYRDKANNLWVGLHQGGLELLQPSSGTFKHYRHNDADPHSINSDIISCILEDSANRFWVGTSKGLDIFDQKQQQFRTYLNDPSKPLKLSSIGIRCIYEDSGHNIWVGTSGGLNLLKAGTTSFIFFRANDRDEKSIKAGYINCIRQDNDGNIWVGSFHGGLSRYNPGDGSFKTYQIKDGLLSDNVLNIIPADAHDLWISTNNGLTKFNTLTQKFKNYTVADGLPTNEFNYNSSYKDADGILYFGTYNGLISFDPKQIKENKVTPAVLFTGLKLFNHPVNISDQTGLLQKHISLTKAIIFRSDQNVFTLDFTALDYDKPGENQFMYKLKGFEKNWNVVDVPSATYTNLPAGDYDFLVKASNADGYWNNNTTGLHIVILPPLWRTWWAYTFYVLAFAGSLFLVIRFFRRQARLERDLYYEHLNYERQQEVHQMKLDFFTKVSHEIRTPLTLILAPVEKLIDTTLDNPLVSRQLTYVKQNADRLLRLVNELLDFRKIETGHLQLHVSEHDLIRFCEDIFSSFERTSIQKSITYQFKPAIDSLPLYFDPAQFEKVLFNILSNAFKFTPDEGTITLSVTADAQWVNIIIADNGAGIAAEQQAHIFENFYQARNNTTSPGWGIGLALVKNIVDQHKGKISVESELATDAQPGKTVFTISLLKGKAHFDAADLDDTPAQSYAIQQAVATPVMANTESLSPIAEKQSILLVEDNNEVRGLIRESLATSYNIHESINGAEGWETACQLIPDLIISDVTMPVMDGLEFCSKIKTDERTNHIPVILLTAKAAYDHQVSGLENGADVYITKPFKMQLLELTIRNLMMTRQSMREKFGQQITLMPKNKVIESPDEKFLNKLMTIVETHMEDSEFDVVKLVNEIGMSQSILYRKIKALTDLSTGDFIKSVRLKQAALLLAQQKLSIAEVAYAVGFSDRKYFSKEFKKQFGKTPSEYIEQ
ncbi:hybrid sensor histidine kinase/response regulator [Mucilaginibacter sp. PPCGB 2223]|uniref:hybrid sensor histidine kinase/response regulator transcription factor n=1 Tax=Mucilaginibacter sp. PPCGB 2223 TaxID=1886027 RepID=UPI0008246FA5|nr:two-component regulator propeller domain-containing protein [Mucilaginibacter sp. PPCGB 2223]OCX51554.1 hybrid sensor histidine kinase/response regulator [Mucilaginibacter sp. PPCGB 2223]